MGGRIERAFWRQACLVAALSGLMTVFAAVNSPPASAGAPPPQPESPAAAASAPPTPTSAVDATAPGPAAPEPAKLTERAAFAEAARIDRPVEILAFRGESREVFANPDGTLTATEYTEPVRVLRGGKWVPVDTTLVKAADGSVGPTAIPLGLRLSGGGDTPLVHVERANRSMSLDWPGSLPVPVLAGDKATYREVLPGVDLTVVVSVTGFSHILVIKTPEAAENPALAAVDFALETKNLSVRDAGDNGGLVAIDTATGGAVLEAATPVMWDSGTQSPPGAQAPANRAAADTAPEGAKRTEIDVRVNSDSVTVVPDQAMLTDPATRWPVYVDPIWQDTGASSWAMVDSGYPNQEYWKFKDHEGVGECPVKSRQCAGSKIKRLFYALPTPYQGRTILEAKLRVTMVHTFDNSKARNVSLYRASKPIQSGTNWNDKPEMAVHQETVDPTDTQGSCSGKRNVVFNAKPAVEEAVRYGWTTTTFGIRAQDESDHVAWKRFCNNAILSVRYNRAPLRPAQSDLTSAPGGHCVAGDARPYVDEPPVLYMFLHDPDHSARAVENVRGDVRIDWNNSDGTQTTRVIGTDWKASSSRFSVQVPADIPQNTVIHWAVRASDGTAWGPWSSEGGQSACEFIFDNMNPPAPDIDSVEYLPADVGESTSACVPNVTALGAVGWYGTFVFDAPGTDAVRYEYGFNGSASPNNVLIPATPGGPVSLVWLPEQDGANHVTVRTVDRANRRSSEALCHFDVATRRAAGDWTLGDADTATAAADGNERHPAVRGGDVTFGVPGPGCQNIGGSCQVDRAVRMTGSADSFLSVSGGPGLVDTSQRFSVTAWVRLTDNTRSHVAVSQDGTGEPGFTLGFDASSKKWVFGSPAMDVDSFGGWSTTSRDPAAVGAWTHLAGVYDPHRGSLMLYVNGELQATGPRGSRWKARGTVQIGRRVTKSGYVDNWAGDLADVAIYDRITVPAEIAAMARLLPVRVAYWPLDSAADGRSPEYRGGVGGDLLIGGGASIYAPEPDTTPFGERPLAGAGHLALDGVAGHARTAGPVVATDASFTVAVRVRLSSDTCGRNMAVVSQAGAAASAFVIRCRVDNRWEVVLPHRDISNTATSIVLDDQSAAHGRTSGQHLAVTYNSLRKEVKLYVDGQLALSGSQPHGSAWAASGGLQIGRALVNGAFGEHFAGVVDDVRVYRGVADQDVVQRMADPTANPHI